MRRERGEGRLFWDASMAFAKPLQWERREYKKLRRQGGWSRLVET